MLPAEEDLHAGCNETIARLERELAEARAQTEADGSTISYLHNELKNTKAELANAKDQIEELKGESANLEWAANEPMR